MTKTLLLIALLCLGNAAPALAADTVLMERMTSYEIRDAIAAGKTTVIVPSGGTEQNGPAMATGKHNFRVFANAQTIARRLGNALVTSVISFTPEGRYDPPQGHLKYPGTIGVPDDVYAGVLEGVCRSLKLHGFHDIVLIGDHGSDITGQNAVAAKLNAEWAATPVRVHAISVYYRGDMAGDQAEMMKMGIRREEFGNHSDVRDTSQLLYIDPSLVHTDRLEAGDGKNGVEGDPRHSTVEIGRMLTERSIARTLAAIKASIASTPR